MPKRITKEPEISLPTIRKSMNLAEKKIEKDTEAYGKEKLEAALGRKLIDDLKN